MLLVEGDAILDDAVLQVGVRGNDKLVEGSALTLFRVDGSISAEGFAPGDTVPIKVGSTVISNIVLDPIFDGELSGGTFTGIVTYPPDSGDDEDPWSPPLTPPEEIDPKPEPGPDDGGGGGGDIGGDVTGNTASEESKALSEGFLGAIGLTSQGSDLIAFEGSPAAVRSADAAGAYSAAGFGAASGGVVRHNTGSYAETRGFSIMAGLAKGIDMTSGRLTLGVFAELGSGSYDTYNSFAGAIVEGDGDARYLGGGALFRMDFNSSRAKGGAYLEASARGGTLRNKYKSLDLKDISGVAAEYETSSGYYGFHLGAGYIWGISDRINLDLYGKYFWTRQKGCETTLSTGEDLRFEDSDSSRIRVGGRISYAATRLISPYFGLAYERELQGKARVTTNGLPIDVPSLSGSTGVGELGFELSPGESFPLTFDLGAQGYTGKKEGVTGSIKINYVF
jgi:uncharacterized protein YhjY with autotransporter beta-barrel domain